MKKEIIKPFSLEAWKNGAKIKTREGHEARIICTDAKNEYYPILGLVAGNGDEHIVFYTLEGKLCRTKSAIRDEDLVIVEEVEEPEFWSDKEDKEAMEIQDFIKKNGIENAIVKYTGLEKYTKLFKLIMSYV